MRPDVPGEELALMASGRRDLLEIAGAAGLPDAVEDQGDRLERQAAAAIDDFLEVSAMALDVHAGSLEKAVEVSSGDPDLGIVLARPKPQETPNPPEQTRHGVSLPPGAG